MFSINNKNTIGAITFLASTFLLSNITYASDPAVFFKAIDDGRTEFDSRVTNARGTVNSDLIAGLATNTNSWSRSAYTITSTNGANRSYNDNVFANNGGGLVSGGGISMDAVAQPNSIGSGLTFSFNNPVNAFGIELQGWATCCLPSSLYIVFDGGNPILIGTASQTSDEPGYAKSIVTGDTNYRYKTFIGAIDDSATFSSVKIYGTGNGDALNAGGTIRYAVISIGALSGFPVSQGVDDRFVEVAEKTPSDIQNKLRVTSDQERAKASKQLAPEANNSTVKQTMAISGQVGSLIDARTNFVRVAMNNSYLPNQQSNNATGVASGDEVADKGIWGQFFGFSATQDKRKDVDGYDAEAYGFAFGFDNEVVEDVVAGVAFSYGVSNIDGQETTKDNATDIKSYGISLYGTKTMNSWGVDANLGYAYHDYDSRRMVNTAGINQLLEGSYKGDQISAGLGLNKPFSFEKLNMNNWIKLNYSYLKQAGYTEKGGSASLKVDDRSSTSFKTGIGTSFSKNYDMSWGTVTPELRAGWFHEFGNTKTDVTASYAQGVGTAFKTEGVAILRDSLSLGMGFDVITSDSWTFSANYDAELKQDYRSHTARLQTRYDF